MSTTSTSASIEFSAEQGLLLDIAARTLRDRWPIEKVRENLESGPGWEETLWSEVIDLGWTGLALPEGHGGAAQGLGDLVPLVEPMGRHLVSGPFVPTQIAAQGLLAAQRSGEGESEIGEWLQRINDGANIALALFEGDGSWDLSDPQTTLEGSGDTLRLHGTKVLVHDLHEAAGALVSARHDGVLCFVVLTAEQLQRCERQQETVIDLTRRTWELRLDLEVEAQQVIAGDAARETLRALTEAAWLLNAAEACGGIQGTLDVLLEYLKSRRQFGRTIGSYQALKHPTVDILIGLERSRSLLYAAATTVNREDSSAEERAVALRMAKAESSRAFLFAGDRAIQFHGGVGFTWECDAQLYLRRAVWLHSQWGDPMHHRKYLADLVL